MSAVKPSMLSTVLSDTLHSFCTEGSMPVGPVLSSITGADRMSIAQPPHASHLDAIERFQQRILLAKLEDDLDDAAQATEAP